MALPETLTKQVVMEVAWRDFIDWAWRSKEPDLRRAFEMDTGTLPLGKSPRSPLEFMIDQACERDHQTILTAYVENFVHWVTETQWGWDEAPVAYRAKYPPSVVAL